MDKDIHLSLRMETIVSMVSKGNRVCDVGCDHGFVDIALVKRGISPTAVAMDVNEGPLKRADEHIVEEMLGDRIRTVLSDGLNRYIIGEADSLIIAGMGGPLMIRILSEEKEKTDSFAELILSPQSQISDVRIFLYENGFVIDDENMVFEDGKYYVVMHVVPGEGAINACEASYGPVLIKKSEDIFRQYIDNLIDKHNKLLCQLAEAPKTSANEARKKELKEELKLLAEAMGGPAEETIRRYYGKTFN